VNGEPNKDLVGFYDGRLIPQPTEGDTYTKELIVWIRMLVCDVKDNKVQYMEHKFTNGKKLTIIEFLKRFKIENNG
jgi:hypothetical protein